MADEQNNPTPSPGSDDQASKKKPGPPKGKRYGGRKKGTPNKRDAQFKSAAQICAEEGIDPIRSFCWIVQNRDMATGLPYEKKVIVGRGDNQRVEVLHEYQEDTRKFALSELGSYIHPKKKAIEHTGGDGKPLAPPELHIHFV